MSWKSKLIRLLRDGHRDLGYFSVAIILVYALSGIFLTHKDIFPVFSTSETYSEFPPDFGIAGFSEYWERENPKLTLSKCFTKSDVVLFYYKGGKGKYIINTGEVVIENYHKHHLTALVNQLHFNQIKYWRYVADFFCVSLIFLAVSGLVIVKGKKGFKKRGWWFMLGGVVLVLVFVII